jgi:hypothetical protein
MSRIRTIKPEFWTSEQIANCSRDARLLFIGLWNFCDDAGIHPASSKRIKMEIFPADDLSPDQIKTLLDELKSSNLIREYAVGQEVFWQVTGWKKHQRIDRPSYKYPPPETELKIISNSASDQKGIKDGSSKIQQTIAEYSKNTFGAVDDCSTTEWKGVEGNGEEDKICDAEASPCINQEAQDINSLQDQVLEIFKYWQITLNHHKAKLDTKRKKKIEAALKLNYSVEDLKRAIDGCSKSPFHMGSNESHKRYDSIDLIFRSADHIESFMNDVTSNITLDSYTNATSPFAGAY